MTEVTAIEIIIEVVAVVVAPVRAGGTAATKCLSKIVLVLLKRCTLVENAIIGEGTSPKLWKSRSKVALSNNYIDTLLVHVVLPSVAWYFFCYEIERVSRLI